MFIDNLKVTTTSFDQSLSCVHWMDVKQPHKGTFTNLLTVYSMFVVVGEQGKKGGSCPPITFY